MKPLFKTVFTIYLLLLLWLVLGKFSLDLGGILEQQTRSINLIPFVDISTSLLGTIENGIIFIPFGLLLCVNFKQLTWQKMMAIIFYFSLGVEITQFIFGIGITDITDVIMNTSGGLLGIGLYHLASKRVKPKKLDWSIIISCLLISTLILTILFSHRIRIEMGHVKHTQATTTFNTSKLTWPSIGQAAIGTVQDGVIARTQKNEQAQPTASMAKIITALAVLKKQPLGVGQSGPTYSITPNDVTIYHMYAAKNGSVLPVQVGMTLTKYQALQAMLLPSANNIADLLAIQTFGSIETYKTYAQNMMKEMGLTQTTIADASGFSSATTSTPSELVTIGIAALKNPIIAQIVAQSQAVIPGVGMVTNTNKLLGTSGVVGIKTGTTDQAGTCLLFAASYLTKDGQQKTIVGVVMGDVNEEQLFSDSQALLISMQNTLEATVDSHTLSAAHS